MNYYLIMSLGSLLQVPVDFLFGVFGLKVTTRKTYDKYLSGLAELADLRSRWNGANVALLCSGETEARSAHVQSRSQLGQEIFALYANGFEKNRFFVEFGAADGVNLSNTLVLESVYGWKGVLAEPNTSYSRQLRKNRSADVDSRAVTGWSGADIEFLEAGLNSSAFATRNMTRWGAARPSYLVKTVSLNDLLREHSAPDQIGFLSIDTEGSEFEALASLDFSHYRFNAIAIEHNGKDAQIRHLMTKHGYTQVLTRFSAYDMWFVPVANPHRLPA